MRKNDPIKLLVNFVAVLGIAGYFGAILYLGIPKWHSGDSADSLKIISGIVTAIGGALATFFGAAVGLNQAKGAAGGAAGGVLERVATLTWLQVISAWAYFVSLVLAFGLWANDGFK